MAQPYGSKRNQSSGGFLICILTETFTTLWDGAYFFLPYYWGRTWGSEVSNFLLKQWINGPYWGLLGSDTTGVRNRSGEQKTWDLSLTSCKALEKPHEPVHIPLSAPPSGGKNSCVPTGESEKSAWWLLSSKIQPALGLHPCSRDSCMSAVVISRHFWEKKPG